MTEDQKSKIKIYNEAFDNFILRKGKGQLSPVHCYSLVMTHPTINYQIYNCFKTKTNSITIIPYNNGEVLFNLDPNYIRESDSGGITVFSIKYKGAVLTIYFDRIL